MPDKKNEAIASLERLGLSSYESKAFVAAVGQPPLTCYKLAQLSGVPRARIYEVVDKLAAKGLIIFQSGDRTLLTAADHKAFLDQKEAESREIIHGLRSSLASVPKVESASIWNLVGRRQIIQTARDLIAAAGRFAYLSITAEDFGELKADWKKLSSRRIAVYGVYCGEMASPPPGLAKHLGEACLKCGEIALVIDGERALIGCLRPEDSAAAALTQNQGLVNVAQEYIRHEVFLNSLFVEEHRAVKNAYIKKYERLMRRLP